MIAVGLIKIVSPTARKWIQTKEVSGASENFLVDLQYILQPKLSEI